MSEEQPLYLACHCQSTVFKVNIPAKELEEKVTACDCSHCLKRRGQWCFVDPALVKPVRGEENLQAYIFGNQSFSHQFCPTCGTHVQTKLFKPQDPPRMIINARAIRSEDSAFDPFNIKPSRIAPGTIPGTPFPAVTLDDLPGAETFLQDRTSASPDFKIHLGSCHCKAVSFAYAGKPMEEAHVKDCGCSICLGNGTVWTRPGAESIIFYPSEPDRRGSPRQDLVTKYTFGPRQWEHFFCKVCGLEIYKDDTSSAYNPQINVMLLNEAHDFLEDLQHVDAEKVEILHMNKTSLAFFEDQKRIKEFHRDRGEGGSAGVYRVNA